MDFPISGNLSISLAMHADCIQANPEIFCHTSYSVVLFVRCDMGDDEEYESVNLFASYEPYELIVGLF